MTSSGRQGGERKGQEREERPQREPGEKGDRAPSTRPWVSLYIPTGEEGAAPASPGHRNGQAVPNGGSSPPGPSHRGGQAVPYSSRRSLPGPGHTGGTSPPAPCRWPAAPRRPVHAAGQSPPRRQTPAVRGQRQLRGVDGRDQGRQERLHPLSDPRVTSNLGRSCPVAMRCVQDTTLTFPPPLRKPWGSPP